MLTDPQSITISGVAKSMPKILAQGLKSVYQSNDKAYTLTISHQESGKKVRTLVRFDLRAVKADPLTSANNWETLSFQTVIDRPLTGFSVTDLTDHITGFKTWFDNTLVGKLYGEES